MNPRQEFGIKESFFHLRTIIIRIETRSNNPNFNSGNVRKNNNSRNNDFRNQNAYQTKINKPVQRVQQMEVNQSTYQ